MKNEAHILKIIGQIKKELKTVSSMEVARMLRCSRQNVYKHLYRGEFANIDQLNRIVQAIEKVKKTNAEKEAKQLKLLSKKLIA